MRVLKVVTVVAVLAWTVQGASAASLYGTVGHGGALTWQRYIDPTAALALRIRQA